LSSGVFTEARYYLWEPRTAPSIRLPLLACAHPTLLAIEPRETWASNSLLMPCRNGEIYLYRDGFTLHRCAATERRVGVEQTTTHIVECARSMHGDRVPAMSMFTSLALLALLSSCSSARTLDSCKVHADCVSSEAAERVGRCAPKEIYCSEERCGAMCARICRTVSSDVNACEGGLICNEPQTSAAELSYCTGVPIPCVSVGDCPLYRPRDTSGAQGLWSCNDGICRHPGLRYRWE
jgi:hypothetical protein